MSFTETLQGLTGKPLADCTNQELYLALLESRTTATNLIIRNVHLAHNKLLAKINFVINL